MEAVAKTERKSDGPSLSGSIDSKFEKGNLYAKSPFHLENEDAYRAWKNQKIGLYPATAEDLIVTVQNLDRVTSEEKGRILERVQKANMAVYRLDQFQTEEIEVRASIKKFGSVFGLKNLNANYFAGEDGVTALRVSEGGTEGDFIPYTDRPIQWHTDGYYNPEGKQILGLILHCVRPAKEGGINRLLDPEMLYMLIRDRHPEYIKALMSGNVMSIPAAYVDGKCIRPEEGGPVFSVREDGTLFMRYTARKKNIRWRSDEITRKAVDMMKSILSDTENPYVFQVRLQPGEGLICNNVLHDRTGFVDGGHEGRRLLFRARYFDRIQEPEAGKVEL